MFKRGIYIFEDNNKTRRKNSDKKKMQNYN